MKQRLAKRALSLLLTLVMLIGLVPMAGAAAVTAEETVQLAESAPATQSDEPLLSEYELWGSFNAYAEPISMYLNEDGTVASCCARVSEGSYTAIYRNGNSESEKHQFTISEGNTGVVTFNLNLYKNTPGELSCELAITKPSAGEEVPDSYIGAEPTADGFEYVIFQGEAFISKYIGTDVDVVVPERIDGFQVVGIGREAFKIESINGSSTVESITLPSTLRAIGMSAFDNVSFLKEVVVPSGAQIIDSYAFRNCSSLNSVSFPDTIIRAGADILDGTAYYADEDNWTDGKILYVGTTLICAAHMQVYSEKEDDYFAPYGDVFVKPGTKVIADYAFCNIDYRGGAILEQRRGRAIIGQLVIPEGVVYIGNNAFEQCFSIGSVTLPSTITAINEGTFKLSNIGSFVEIPEGVERICAHAFDGCKADFEGVYAGGTLVFPSTLKSIGSYAYSGSDLFNEVIFPIGFKYLGEYAFFSNLYLASVVFNDVVRIDRCAFDTCEMLTNVVLPSSLRVIGESAFASGHKIVDVAGGQTSVLVYNKITEIKLPQGIEYIGAHTFSGCTSLVTINLPEGLEYIGSYCFNKCYSLKTVTFPDSLTYLGSYVLKDCTSLGGVNFPEKALFPNVDGIVNGTNIVQLNIPDGVECVSNFYDSTLRSIEIPKTVKKITNMHNAPIYAVRYKGTESQWGDIYFYNPSNVTIAPSGTFPNATIYFLGNEVTWSEGEHYELIPYDDTEVEDGNSFSFSVDVEEGYNLISVVSRMQVLTPDAQGVYTIENITEDTSIIVIVEGDSFVYDVKFIAKDGSVLSEQKVHHGMAAEAPEAPVYFNYTFTGWSEDFSKVTEDMTVKAQYEYTPAVYLKGAFNNWSTDSPMNVVKGTTDYSYIINLEKGNYDFKIVIVNDNGSDIWYGNDGNINDVTTTGWVFETRLGNCTLVARGGTYEFKFNIDSKKLEVSRVPDVTVTFTDKDGEVISTQTIPYGTAAVSPEAPKVEGYEFKGWSAEFDCVTEDMTVKAKYSKLPPTTGNLRVEVTGGRGFTISVDGGVSRPQGVTYHNSKLSIGSTVTLTANTADNANFFGWVNPITGIILSADPVYTFTASGNDSLKALYAVAVEGVNVVTFKNDKSNRILDSQYYASADVVTFPDAPTQVGYDFAGWSMTEAEIKSAIAKGEDVTVVAKWTKSLVPVEITVNGGTGSGTYYANNAVTVTANEAEMGQKFAYWTDAQGNIRSYNAEYTFFPAKDTTVTAVFVDADAEIDYQILVSLDSIDTTTVEGKNVFTYSWYCPDSYSFVKAGIVAVNKDNYNEATFVAGSSDSNVYDRSPNSANNVPVNTYTWSKSNVTSGQTWMARAYVQYRDANGDLQTVYSDIAEATKD